jgi:hypothetical protein
MIYWTLDGLYTAISKADLESLLGGEIRENDKRNRPMREIRKNCERATDVVLEILGTSADGVLSKDPNIAPTVVRECIEVEAAVFLSTKSAMLELKDKLEQRWKHAREMLKMLRNNTVSPAKRPQRISFGESEF